MKLVKLLLKPFGYMVMIESFFMALCFFGEFGSGGKNIFGFGASFCITLFFALMFLFASKGVSFRPILGKDGVILTMASWLICVPFGILPYKFSTLGMTYTESVFEFMSALTTTGCTLFLQSADVGIGLKLWHTFVAGIGGIGVVIIYFVFLSGSAEFSNGLHNFARKDFSNEYTSEPMVIRNLVKKVILVYLGMMFFCSFAYLLSGISLLSSITTAVATVSTGGFVHEPSFLNIFNSSPRMMIAMLFMIISSMPLMLIFVSIERRSVNFFKMDQVFWFLLIILLFGVVIMAKSYSQDKFLSFSVFVRCLFYTISSITTTGFGLDGVSIAKDSVIAVLLLLPIIGGCSGSTAGGLKVYRFVVIFKVLGMEIDSKVSPKRITQVKINGRNVDKSSIDSSVLLFGVYFLTIFVFTVLVSLLVELDFSRSFFLIVSMITNSGLADLSPLSEVFVNIVDKNTILFISSFVMLVGRVELFAAYFLFSKKLWES